MEQEQTIPTEQRLLLSVLEAAQLLNIGRSSAFRLIQRGELPAVRIGGRVLVRPDDLRAYTEHLESVRPTAVR